MHNDEHSDFDRYISNLILWIYWDILGNIDEYLTQNIDRAKIDQTYENVGKLSRNDIRSNNTYIIYYNWYMKKLIYEWYNL